MFGQMGWYPDDGSDKPDEAMASTEGPKKQGKARVRSRSPSRKP